MAFMNRRRIASVEAVPVTDAALAAVHAAALELGRQLFGPFLRSGVDLGGLTAEQLQAATDQRARAILTADLSAQQSN
ncbi:hypothetical protein [Nocardia stercoris]|uniref:hypothetical protein n=1 Tax=Nocardia stercoris TaxID=2483361 RepID=UPI0011C47567|nr:hypothetical protein [Nocardia stercoris]